MHQKSNIDLLVVSCDSYSDVWDTFFKFFFTCWNDCPLDIYLLTNEKTFDQLPVKTIRVGRDISWSDNLLSGIDQLKKDYVLLLFGDCGVYYSSGSPLQGYPLAESIRTQFAQGC